MHRASLRPYVPLVSMAVWSACGYGASLAVQGHAARWSQAAAFTAAAFFYQLWRNNRNRLAWLCCQEDEMVEAARYQGKLSALPTREQSDAMRAMVMDPEIDETMRAALQPLAAYLEHMERVRDGAEQPQEPA